MIKQEIIDILGQNDLLWQGVNGINNPANE